jgi:hypothetical protein
MHKLGLYSAAIMYTYTYIHIYIEREREGGGSVKRVAVKFEKSEVKL